MNLLLLLALGAAGYWYVTKGRMPAGVVDKAGAQYFDEDSKRAVLAALPMLGAVPVASVPGAQNFVLGSPEPLVPNAGEVATIGMGASKLVAASASLLSTKVADHALVVAEPSMRMTVAGPGSPLAILFDPERP